MKKEKSYKYRNSICESILFYEVLIDPLYLYKLVVWLALWIIRITPQGYEFEAAFMSC